VREVVGAAGLLQKIDHRLVFLGKVGGVGVVAQAGLHGFDDVGVEGVEDFTGFVEGGIQLGGKSVGLPLLQPNKIFGCRDGGTAILVLGDLHPGVTRLNHLHDVAGIGI